MKWDEERQLSWEEIAREASQAEEQMRLEGSAKLFAYAAKTAQGSDCWSRAVSLYLERLAEEETA